MSKLARTVRKDDDAIKFDESGVLAFSNKMPEILKESGITGISFDVLHSFCTGLQSIFNALLDTPLSLTGPQFACLARLFLGLQFVFIFGTRYVTPSIKQIVVYTSYYISKAREDGAITGQDLKFSNFSDGLMETQHKYAKSGTFLYSGGRQGTVSSAEYQKLVLSQLFHNELYRVDQRESSVQRSTESKLSRKRQHSPDEDEQHQRLKRKSVGQFFVQ